MLCVIRYLSQVLFFWNCNHSGNKYFSKSSEAIISEIKKYFSLTVPTIFSKWVSTFHMIFQFKKCKILYELGFKYKSFGNFMYDLHKQVRSYVLLLILSCVHLICHCKFYIFLHWIVCMKWISISHFFVFSQGYTDETTSENFGTKILKSQRKKRMKK